MNATQLESHCLLLVDRLLRGQPVEDSSAEFKSDWPPPARAARLVAAHANSARADSVLWLLGVDEKARLVPGVANVERASWYQQFTSYFDGVAPSLALDLNIPFQGKTLVALLFGTGRRPFVIHNPEARRVEREVPWREATGVRAARREDLLLLLEPSVRLPRVEVREARVELLVRPTATWVLDAVLYIDRPGSEELVVPMHRSEFSLAIPAILPESALTEVYAETSKAGRITFTGDELILGGSGAVHITGSCDAPVTELGDSREAFARIRLQPSFSASSVFTESVLTRVPEPGAIPTYFFPSR